MATKIAINGFGRIGRLFFRQAFGKEGYEIAAINDLGDIENLAYLLKYDSVYRIWDKEVVFDAVARTITVDGRVVQVLQEKDPAALPWKQMDVDIVVESTGFFESYAAARAHITAGAKRVVITAPAKDEDGGDAKTVLCGINEADLETTVISSNGSCTTNSAAPVIQILDEAIGVEKALLGTVHAYTGTQSITDTPVKGGKDFRRGRAGVLNITPSSTGAAIAVGRVVPDVAGKFDGVAYRVPVPTGSLSDITFVAKRDTTVEEVNSILEAAATQERWKNTVRATRDQIVSADIIGLPYGAIVDLSFTRVVGGNLVKVLSWYDNEMGYVSTLLSHVERAASYLKK